jgi:hypothetical protein
MYSCSYGIRNFVLFIRFKSFIVLCIGPYDVSIVEDMQWVGRLGVTVFYLSVVFLVSSFKLRFVCPMYFCVVGMW